VTLLDYAAGVIMTGFDATVLDETEARRLQRLPFAGYILFARNVISIEQVRALTDRLRSFSKRPPIVAVDQEGGRVARLRNGVEELPPMMAVGATRDAMLAQHAGEQLAFDLRRAGFTHDFAPVVDLAVNPRNTVIGSRAFGASPSLVIEMAGAFARGMRRGGLTPTLKHFPGHGDTAADSHLELPYIDADATTLRARDLAPFEALLPVAGSIMAAHVVVRAFDEAVPATVSPRLLTGLLRDEWGFEGVCFTDCMQMDAIARGIGTVEGVAAAIAAGADCALVSHDVELAERAAYNLASEVEAGRIPESRLREAFDRVSTLRSAAPPPLPLDASPPHPGIGREIARCAVTRVRGVPHADATASLVVTFEGSTSEGAQGTLDVQPSLCSQAPVLEEMRLPLEPSATEIPSILAAIRESQRRPIVLSRRAAWIDSQAACIRAIVERFPDTLLVCAREPLDCEQFPAAQHVLAMYGDGAVSLGGLADVIFGDGEAEGALPVDTLAVK
jgi:beta-N-acetylhexosaminidase